MAIAGADSPSARLGSTLRGKWTLEKLLGEGGMASVYVARHKIGRLEAIKIMHPFVAGSPELRARFEQEARLANRFRHPGAVEIRDIDVTDDGAPFLVMELLEGETLSSIARAKKGPLDVAMVLRVADEVLDVLAAAHESGIIHRDIKPDNLLLTKDGHVKVLDFGIARLREGMARDVKTHTGTTLGTVAYMAPEQAKSSGDVDARADLYAVGATMFRLLAGRRVHEADTEAERLAKLVSGPAPLLGSIAPAVPAAVCAVVDRALQVDRTNRYPTAGVMQAEVRRAAGEADALGSTTTPMDAPTVVDAPRSAPRSEAATVAESGRGEGARATGEAATVRDGPPVMSARRGPGRAAALLAPANRPLLYVLVGACALVLLLVLAAVLVGLRQRAPDPTAPGDSASAAPAPEPLVEPTAPVHPSTHATPTPPRLSPPPPRGMAHGH